MRCFIFRHIEICCSGSNSTAPPTKAVREAVVLAKEEEIERLQAILEEVKRQEKESESALNEKKMAAREFVEAAAPLRSSLAEIQSVTSSWTRRRNLDGC